MNRETILKHSKAVRLNKQLLSDFTDVIAEFCTIKGHPEHLNAIIQLLQQPMIGEQIVNAVLEYFEREYKLIKLEKINIINTGFGDIENKQFFGLASTYSGNNHNFVEIFKTLYSFNPENKTENKTN